MGHSKYPDINKCLLAFLVFFYNQNGEELREEWMGRAEGKEEEEKEVEEKEEMRQSKTRGRKRERG